VHLRHAVRSLIARPAYAGVVLATIALVVGPSTAVFAVLNVTLVRPLPFVKADRLVQVFTLPPHVTDVNQRNPLGSIDFVRFREHVTLAEDLAGIWGRERTIGGRGDPESLPMGLVSANFFRTLGALPLRGRTFTDEEDRDDARVAVLSHGLWQRRFGGDEAILGRHITIDREDYVVIGIMPPSFNPFYVISDLWTPLGISNANLILPNATFIQSVARLRQDVAPAELRAELAMVMQAVAKENPSGRGGWTVDVASVREAQFGSTRPALMTLFAAVLALALMAAANLTNLTVAEVANRRHDFVLRAALGASRVDLLRTTIVESVLLAAAGGAAGLVLASWCLPAVLALDPTTATPFGHVTVDWRVLVAASALALAVSLVAGTVPVLAATRGGVARALAEGARRAAGSRRGRRVRSTLVAVEILLAVVLVTSGGLLLSAFDENARTNPGFDPHQVLGGELRLSAVAYPTAASRWQLVQTVLDRLKHTPGVVDAGTTLNLFQPGFAFVTLVTIEGRPAPDGQAYTVQFRRASPGYFRTMRIPVLRGRTFGDADTETSQPVAVVSQAFADAYWPGEDAVGRRVTRGTDRHHWLTVIGIVGDVSDVGFGQSPAPTIYVAYAQNNVATASVGLVVRTAGEPAPVARAVARAIHEVDAEQPLSSVTTLDQFLADSLGPDRFRSVLLLVFAATGLLLGAVGIYGVASRGVAERTRELGVRLALGSQPADLRKLVLRQAAAGIGGGFAMGLPAAWLAARALRHWMPGVAHAQSAPALVALLVLGIAGFIAAGVPALRAGCVDPREALRAD
jgi:putative ABC transport system permease protein